MHHEKNLLIDILFFIQYNGDLVSVDSLSGTKKENLFSLSLRDRLLTESVFSVDSQIQTYPMSYLFQKISTLPILKSIVSRKDSSYYIRETELKLLRDLIDTFQSTPTCSNWDKIGMFFSKRQMMKIELFFTDEYIGFDHMDTCYSSPYSTTYVREVHNLAPFISKSKIDLGENRILSLLGMESILFEPLMKLAIQDEPESYAFVRTSTKSSTSVCEQCVNRLRKITQGCFICTPKKTSLT